MVAAAEAAAMEKLCSLFDKKVRAPARQLVREKATAATTARPCKRSSYGSLEACAAVAFRFQRVIPTPPLQVAEFVSLFAPPARVPRLQRVLDACLPVLPTSARGSQPGAATARTLPAAAASAAAAPSQPQGSKRSAALAARAGGGKSNAAPAMPPAKTPFKPASAQSSASGASSAAVALRAAARPSVFSMDDLEDSELNRPLERRVTPAAAALAAAAAAAAAAPVLGWECNICHESGESTYARGLCGARQPLVARCGHVACKGCWAHWKRSAANQAQVNARATAAKGNNSEDAAMLCPVCRGPIPLGSLRFLVAQRRENAPEQPAE
jgi:hypothetical protein